MISQKHKGERRPIVKMKIIIMMAAVMLLPLSQVQAIDVDFYHDAVIDEGDIYDIVSVYDTPPDLTTVDTYGGSIESLRTYDSSTANIYGGEIWIDPQSYNSSTINIYGGSLICQSIIVWDSAILNIYGGDLNVGNAPYFSESSEVNIHGYGFSYDGVRHLTGFLTDGSSFIFNELSPSRYSHINLIVMPEPTTLLLVGLGCLLIRKRR